MELKGSVPIFWGVLVISKGLYLVTTIYCGDSQTVGPDAQRDVPKYYYFFQFMCIFFSKSYRVFRTQIVIMPFGPNHLKKKQVALIMLIIALQFDVSTSFNM